jgi:hypothetical protein
MLPRHAIIAGDNPCFTSFTFPKTGRVDERMDLLFRALNLRQIRNTLILAFGAVLAAFSSHGLAIVETSRFHSLARKEVESALVQCLFASATPRTS